MEDLHKELEKNSFTHIEQEGLTKKVLLRLIYEASPDDLQEYLVDAQVEDLPENMVFITGIPEWAMCYLFNDDSSGLEEGQKEQVDEYMKANNLVDACSIVIGAREEFNTRPQIGDDDAHTEGVIFIKETDYKL